MKNFEAIDICRCLTGNMSLTDEERKALKKVLIMLDSALTILLLQDQQKEGREFPSG